MWVCGHAHRMETIAVLARPRKGFAGRDNRATLGVESHPLSLEQVAMIVTNFDYESCVRASEKVAWKLDEVFPPI